MGMNKERWYKHHYDHPLNVEKSREVPCDGEPNQELELAPKGWKPGGDGTGRNFGGNLEVFGKRYGFDVLYDLMQMVYSTSIEHAMRIGDA